MLWTCPICEAFLPTPFLPWCEDCEQVPLWRTTDSSGEGTPSPSPLEKVVHPYWLGGFTYRKLLLWKTRPSTGIRARVLRFSEEELGLLRSFQADAVTWIPQNNVRSWRLGRSPAKECAAALSRSLGVPVWDFLRREDSLDFTRQAELERADREARALSYRVRASALHASRAKRVILVDDFSTTGRTLTEGGRALKDAGVKKILGWCLGRRPPRQAPLQDSSSQKGFQA